MELCWRTDWFLNYNKKYAEDKADHSHGTSTFVQTILILTTLQFANCLSVCLSALDLNLFLTYRAVTSANRRGLLPRCAPRYTFFVTRLIDGEKSKLVGFGGCTSVLFVLIKPKKHTRPSFSSLKNQADPKCRRAGAVTNAGCLLRRPCARLG